MRWDSRYIHGGLCWYELVILQADKNQIEACKKFLIVVRLPSLTYQNVNIKLWE